MLDPTALLTDSIKTRLIDTGLTKLADAADSAGSTQLAQALRRLRSDTPFIEDVSAGLGRALESFSADWENRDPELVAVIGDASLWQSTDLLGDLATTLMRPTSGHGPEFGRMKDALTSVAPHIPDDRLAEGLDFLINKVREELFDHPKLRDVHSLYLQVVNAERQTAILEELRAIKDNTAALAMRAPEVNRRGISSVRPRLEASKSARALPAVSPAPKVKSADETPSGRLPDVLTPCLDSSQLIVPSYLPVVGKEAAFWLDGVLASITDSIEKADFVGQKAMADRLLANNLGLRSLEASAHYMLGEAQRLQADFIDSFDEREQLLDLAIESYSAALELDTTSARAQRGLGRAHEVKGDLGSALALYEKARISALHMLAEEEQSVSSETAHEVLRLTRHYAAALSQRIRDDPHGLSARDSKLRQLHGLILQSEELHRSILPRFGAQADWMHIEWFMGLILLAKAYVVVGDSQRAWLSLLHALSARMAMMDPTKAAFSSVEYGNLIWWCGVARGVKPPMADFDEAVERIAEAVTTGDTPAAWLYMQDVVSPIRPPWAVE